MATVDATLEHIGMGRAQVSILIATGLTWSGDAMELGVMAFLVPVLKDEWGMPQAVADTIASMVFAGMLIGALGWGLLSDSHGRRFVWIITTALTAVGGIASAAVPDGSVGALIVARVVVGIGLSGTNLGFALACEFLPGARRGAALVLFELFFSLGSIFEVAVAWLVLPACGWRLMLLLTAAPLLVALALAPAVPESPRLDLVRGHPQRALATLQTLAARNAHPPLDVTEVQLSSSDGEQLLSSSLAIYQSGTISHGSPQTGTADAPSSGVVQMIDRLHGLAHPTLRLAAAGLCVGWFCCTFVYFGIVMLTPKMMQGHPDVPAPPPPPPHLQPPPAAPPPPGCGGGFSYLPSLLVSLAEVPLYMGSHSDTAYATRLLTYHRYTAVTFHETRTHAAARRWCSRKRAILSHDGYWFPRNQPSRRRCRAFSWPRWS